MEDSDHTRASTETTNRVDGDIFPKEENTAADTVDSVDSGSSDSFQNGVDSSDESAILKKNSSLDYDLNVRFLF